jgi:hypothetical protein
LGVLCGFKKVLIPLKTEEGPAFKKNKNRTKVDNKIASSMLNKI